MSDPAASGGIAASPNDPAPPAKKSSARPWILLGVVLTLFAAGAFLPLQAWKTGIEGWLDTLGPWGPVILGMIYIVATVAALPGSILTVLAGALFGLGIGFVTVSIGSTLGATAAFLVGRFLAREGVEGKIAERPKFRAVAEAVGRNGFKIVLLLRLSPVFPFNLLNYGLGVTRVGLRDYFFASWIGMIPGTLLYVYLGSLGGRIGEETTVGAWALQIAGLLATVAVTVLVTRIARQALNQEVGDSQSDASK